ncbi:MAG: adenylosuccinate synthase [Candidatus Bipolaricaulota bacterium]|nr:adenylosuccinate synthase [Candidatus Bipolaricaulota bacterium]
MPAIAVIGAQWGDEAKGKIVHHLSRGARMCVRFNGGANAGHTVEDRLGTARLHLVPSGALHPGCLGVLGHGVVLDPWALQEELAALWAQGRPEPALLLSERAHLVLPHHRAREGEAAGRLGTTRRGIGPAYEDRAARRGLRLADLADPLSVRDHLARMGTESVGEVAEDLARFYAQFSDRIGDARSAIAAALAARETVVFEGAQGTLLDLDLGTYPYVTSSATTVHGIGWGTGVRVALDRVVGVTKAYTTRVGEGPFPTEETGEVGAWLRERGREYGATTGRPRRCGWLDLVALRYAHAVNGFTELALTKLDVLAGLDEVKVCVAYRIGGHRTDRFPARAEELAAAEPEYVALPAWEGPLRDVRDWGGLPREAQRFVRWIEEGVGVPVSLVGTGPGEGAVIDRGRG